MDLLRVPPHGTFGGLESACRRRQGRPDHEAGRICRVRVAGWQSLYDAKGMNIAGLWSVAVNGGEEAPVLDFPKASFWGYWALVETGIYFVNTEATPQPALQFLSFAERRVVHIAALDRKPVPFVSGIAVSPDGRRILYTQEDHRSSDIMLVENFR